MIASSHQRDFCAPSLSLLCVCVWECVGQRLRQQKSTSAGPGASERMCLFSPLLLPCPSFLFCFVLFDFCAAAIKWQHQQQHSRVERKEKRRDGWRNCYYRDCAALCNSTLWPLPSSRSSSTTTWLDMTKKSSSYPSSPPTQPRSLFDYESSRVGEGGGGGGLRSCVCTVPCCWVTGTARTNGRTDGQDVELCDDDDYSTVCVFKHYMTDRPTVLPSISRVGGGMIASLQRISPFQ